MKHCSVGALAMALAILLGTVALVSSSEVRAQEEDAAVAEVRAREIAFAATMSDRDLGAFLAFVSPEAVFFAGNTPLRGRDAVEEAWSPFFDGEEAPFSWSPDVVQVLESGSLALSSGPVLNTSGEVVGRFNSIWRRDSDGVWRVIFDKGC